MFCHIGDQNRYMAKYLEIVFDKATLEILIGVFMNIAQCELQPMQ